MSSRRDYFVDYGLGKGRAAALHRLGVYAHFHTEAGIGQDEDDAVWIPKVAEWGWIILTKNFRMENVETEMRAVVSSGARVFTLTNGQLTGDRMDQILAACLPSMEAFVDTNPGPFFVRISASSELTKVDLNIFPPPHAASLIPTEPR